MASIEHVSVVVQDDFVARQTRAKPIPALAELRTPRGSMWSWFTAA
jgi:hypothetical protein